MSAPRRRLDLTLPAGKGLSLRIVERPGLSLSAEALAKLVSDLNAVARTTLTKGDLDYGVFKQEGDALKSSVVTVVYDDRTRQPIAFNALALMAAEMGGRPIEILHLGLVMVDPSRRGRGLSDMLYGLTCVLLFVRRQCRPLYLSNVTQVPAVFGMVAETFADVFPTPERPTAPSFAHRLLARQIMNRWRHVFGVGPDAEYDEERSIIQNAYTGGSDNLKKTFAAAAPHRKAAYNAFCERELDYDRGDDVLQIGQINLEAASRYLARIAQPGSAPWLAGSIVIIALGAAVLPVLHWFADDQAYGALRPWRPVRS